MSRSFLLILIFIVVYIEAAENRTETLKNRNSSIGKFSVFDKSHRAQQIQLRKVFQDLKIRRSSKVADIGAGSGWLTSILAKFVGPKGKIYAVDVVPRYVSSIEELNKQHKLNNIEAILGLETDPKLPLNTLDAVIILIAYHEFQKPFTMLTKIRKAMKHGARLAIIDRDNQQIRMEARQFYQQTGYIPNRTNETLPDHFMTSHNHYIALDIVIRETTTVGFQFLFSRELTDDYYTAFFINP